MLFNVMKLLILKTSSHYQRNWFLISQASIRFHEIVNACVEFIIDLMNDNLKSMHDKIKQLKHNFSHMSGVAGANIHNEVITVYAQRRFEDMADYIFQNAPIFAAYPSAIHPFDGNAIPVPIKNG